MKTLILTFISLIFLVGCGVDLDGLNDHFKDDDSSEATSNNGKAKGKDKSPKQGVNSIEATPRELLVQAGVYLPPNGGDGYDDLRKALGLPQDDPTGASVSIAYDFVGSRKNGLVIRFDFGGGYTDVDGVILTKCGGGYRWVGDGIYVTIEGQVNGTQWGMYLTGALRYVEVPGISAYALCNSPPSVLNYGGYVSSIYHL